MNRRTKLPRVVPRIRLRPILANRRAPAHGGSTLLEILIAMGIVAIALTTFISLLQTGVLTVGSIQDQTIASTLARSQMELVKSAPWPGPYPGINPPTGYEINVSAAPATSPELQVITVAVRRAGRVILTLQGYKGNR